MVDFTTENIREKETITIRGKKHNMFRKSKWMALKSKETIINNNNKR